MMKKLGFDIGSNFCKLVILHPDGTWKASRRPTMGAPARQLALLLEESGLPDHEEVLVGISGVGKEIFDNGMRRHFVSDVAATAAGVRRLRPDAGMIFDMGGEYSRVITLNPDGSVADFAMNGQCAAGAGAFLEQQAGRLQMDVTELSERAMQAERAAVIAGRCSVFAKSDMIHLQQKGTPVEEMAYGLCLALVRTFVSTVLAGRTPKAPLAVVGGGARNGGILRAFSEVFSWPADDFWVPADPQAVTALGAALQAPGRVLSAGDVKEALRRLENAVSRHGQELHLAPLGEPVRREEPAPVQVEPGRKVQAFLGVDVGSVSTNLVLMTPDGRILESLYLATRGQPLAVLQEGMKTLRERFADAVEVVGCGTTGSGRHLAAAVLGADLVKNEITAQMTAAVMAMPEVDTIFEIGGQDSKYIRVENGRMADFTMNKICAAGTGSFLEEEAQRLGVRIIGEFSELALRSRHPCDLGSQCTVFMDTELVHAQRRGASREDICAGLAYSVVRNYLEKVVGNRPVGRNIVFQGGTASNDAVVRAFEKVLERPVRVHPYNRVSGAIGMAWLVSREKPERTAFKGFSADFNPRVTTFECNACTNRCAVSRFSFDGETTFFGDACEKFSSRKDSSARVPAQNLVAMRGEMFRQAFSGLASEGKRRIGIPTTSILREWAPFLARLVSELGFVPVIPDDAHVRDWARGNRGLPSDLCMPLKIAAGQVRWMLEEGSVDAVLYPSVLELPKRQLLNTEIRNMGEMEASHACIFTQEAPFMSARIAGSDRVLVPQFPISFEPSAIHLACSELARVLGVELAAVKTAWARAEAFHRDFAARRASLGRALLSTRPRPILVLLGKPYTLHDSYLNMGLARHLERLGFDVLPMDCLPLDDVELGPEYDRVPWSFSRDLLRAAHLIREIPDAYPVIVSNFGCGPDGFMIKHLEQILRERPKLVLEFDELRGEAGMVTRIEAFADEIEVQRRHAENGPQTPYRFHRPTRVVPRTFNRVFIPYVGPHNAVFEGMLRSLGDVEVINLPPPSHAVMRKGEQIANGKECHPYACLAGDILQLAEQRELRATDAFYMPSTITPCLLSQYGDGYRLWLQERGIPLQILDVIGHDQWDLYGFDGLRRLMDGFFAVDSLTILRHRLRPYEKTTGRVDAVYRQALSEISDALAQRTSPIGAFSRAVSALRVIPLAEDRHSRPLVGFSGDLYTRLSEPANDSFAERLEEAGCEVFHSPYMFGLIWFSNYYDAHRWASRALVKPTMFELLAILATESARRPFFDVLGPDFGPWCREPEYAECMEMVEPYIGRQSNYLVASMLAKMVHFARLGVDGVVNVVATGCMVGCAVNSAVEALSRDYPDVAFLPLVLGVERNLAHVRLETFLHQVREKHARNAERRAGSHRFRT